LSMNKHFHGRPDDDLSDLSMASEGAKKVAPETAWLYSIRWSCKPSPVVPIMRLNIFSGISRFLL